jgi:hypothetical protein
MVVRRAWIRALLPSVVTVGYVALVALRDRGGGERVLVVFAALLLATWAGLIAETLLKLAAWGFAMALVCALSADRPLVLGAGFVAVALALGAAGRAIAIAPSLGGLGAPGKRSRLALAILPAGFALPSAVLAIGLVTHLEFPWPDIATPAIFAVLQLAALWGLLRREHRLRRLDLGLPERLTACTGCVLLAAGGGSVLAFTGAASPFAVSVSLTGASALACTLLSTRGDAVRIARIARRAIVALAAGTSLALFAELLLLDRPRGAADLLLAVTAIAIVCGMLTFELARPLRPAQGAWLDAMAAASEERMRADADEAIRLTLARLREPAGPRAPSPELHLIHPPRRIAIDSAGYAREADSTVPGELLLVACKEPEAVLRTEVIQALEVRRPDLRAVLAWLVDRDALAAVVVTREGEPEGLLVLARGDRDAPVALEEVRALKALADGLAGACHSRAALARSNERERDAERRAEAAEAIAQRLQHEAADGAEREARVTARLARPLTIGLYSASSRSAYEALERRARIGAPFVTLARSGVDPVPYIARAHQASDRSHAPLVLVDGTQSREHDLERWKNRSTSPLGLANRGVLVLLDGAALPVDVQRLIAAAHAEKRGPWEGVLDFVLGLTSARETPEALVATLDSILAARLGDAIENAVRLPSIRDRGEDIRALLTDRLAREGLRARGRPVGIDDGAFGLLVDYPFDGEDAELASIAQRLVQVTDSDVVRAADVCKLQLSTGPVPQMPKIRGV